MFLISKLCILCLTYRNLKSILIKDNDGIVTKQKLKYCFPEIVDFQLDIPQYICENCISKFDKFYTFKQWCLQNSAKLRNYLQTSTSTDETPKYLPVRFSDIKYENNLQAMRRQQTLSIVGSDDVLLTAEKDNEKTSINAAETVFKSEIQCVDVLNNKESHPLFDGEKDIVVKEELLTSEDSVNIDFYHEILQTIKCESNPSDSNVSVPDRINVPEESKDTNNTNDMVLISNLCILCLTYKNLKTISIKDSDGIVIKKKLKYCLPEIIDSQLDIQEYMCVNCLNKLDCFYEFKQCCLQKNIYLKIYMQTLTSTGETYKHLSVKLTDIKHQNNYATCVKNEVECVDVSDMKESRLLSDEEEDIIVKEECVTSENKDDIKFYNEFVNSIKHESILSDSNVSVSDNTDEDSEDSVNSNTKHNSTEAEANVKITNKFQCAICSKEFTRKGSLKYHLKAHAGIEAFSCTICNKKFTCKSSMVNHLKIHTGIKNFECSICNKKFIQKGHLISHEKIHTGVKNFECSICNKKFTRKGDLISHEKIHTGVKNFECSICNKKFTRKGDLISHEKIHTGVKSFECSICNKKFTRKGDLISHEKIHTGVKSFECSICNKKFTRKGDLISHEKIHTGVKSFECSICNKKFTRKGHLISHEKIHTGVKIFECCICNKKFMYKCNLIRHVKHHFGIKNFECSICNKKFTQKGHLISHEKIHTGVKNFECSICNKKFMYKCNLIKHVKHHSGIKNFECSTCNKKFTQKGDLISHEKIHTGVKNFKCSICNKKFANKSNFIKHVKFHSGVKNFECSTCNKKFVEKCDLVRHEKSKIHISRTLIV